MSIKDPNKIFPCDCCGEGLVVSVEKDVDLENTPRGLFINVAFWENGKKFAGHNLGWWDRVKLALHILKGNSPYADMVILNSKVARKFAYHILYLLDKNKTFEKKQDLFDATMTQTDGIWP